MCSDTNPCFGYPEGCISTENCEMVMGYTLAKDDHAFPIVVELFHNQLDNVMYDYVAVAFSTDNMMGDDTVLVSEITKRNRLLWFMSDKFHITICMSN